MGKLTSLKPHLSAYEISEKLKATLGRQHRRWLVIWNALIDPREAKYIALHTGLAVSTVHNLVSKYNRLGPQAVELTNSRKRRRCYMGRAEEAEFISRFTHDATEGQICVARRVKQELEDYLGHSVHHSTVYRMLERNDWRKVVPRPAHPQSKQEIQDDFKKTSQKM